MKTLRRWSLLLALCVVVACQTAAGPPRIASFVADPPVVPAGGLATLRWSVTAGATLDLQPGIGDVTGTTSAVVQPLATTTYVLTATNAAGSDTASATVTIEAVDLDGVVLGVDGRPAAFARVVVDGVGQDLTGADGRFAIADVPVPYTVHVQHPAAPLAVTYVDLTLAHPVLVMSGVPTAAAHTASVYGTVSAGTGFPQPANHVTRVALASPATRATVDADGATGDYQMVAVPWYGADVAGALHALQWQTDAGGLPIAYVGHGYRPIDLTGPIVGYLGQDMALLPVGEASVSGAIDVPPGYVLGARTASVVFPEGGWVVVATEGGATLPFSYLAPLVPDATVAVAALATAPGGELTLAVRAGVSPGTSGVTVAVDPVPQLAAPADAATGVGYATEFAWDAPAGGVAVVLFTGAGAAPDFAVVTDAATARIPDLRELGLDVPPGAAYTWQVVGLARYADVDAAATDADGFLSSWWLNAFFLPHRDASFAPSVQRSLTIAP